MSKIIIVGGTGFLGFHLAKFYKKKMESCQCFKKKTKKNKKII